MSEYHQKYLYEERLSSNVDYDCIEHPYGQGSPALQLPANAEQARLHSDRCAPGGRLSPSLQPAEHR